MDDGPGPERLVEVIGKSVGNYVIEETLGSGAMGSVFLARHPKLERAAAVKFLEPHISSDPELAARFIDEARLTARLRHPNVVDIFDYGELDGRLYYVMEFLPGTDLAEELEVHRPSAEQSVDYLSQICAGLAAAHEAGIVHRDLKPANIFVAKGPKPTLKLMDFGVAKLLSQGATKTDYGKILGTPAYMAPEQALGEIDRISCETDLYSLGAIAYELFTGRAPFEHHSPMMLLMMHVHERPRPIEELAPHLPAALHELVHQCLAKEPALRPSSAQAVLERLRAARKLAPFGTHIVTPRVLPFVEAATLRHEGPPAPPREIKVPVPLEPRLLVPSPRLSESPEPSAIVPSVRLDEALALGTLGVHTFRAPRIQSLEGPRSESVETSTARSVPNTPSIAPTSIGSMPASLIAPLNVDLSHADSEQPAELSKDDRDAFSRLMSRMQRHGDLPVFVANVGEVNVKADYEGKYSAAQLSASILKDYSLTAKLLRVVNTMYANRFGRRVYTVQHAIVIMGFERVRSIALSMSIFNKSSNGVDGRVSDSAIHALVSAEIAREIADTLLGVDPEQAMICSMFKNLGRHLVVAYLPDSFERILEVAARESLSEDRAAERVLGISFFKLGIAVGEQWNLPVRVVKSMSTVIKRDEPVRSDEQRLSALAQLANEFSDLVAAGVGDPEHPEVLKLLKRHDNLVEINGKQLEGLLSRVDDAFRVRYSALLGKRVQSSQFLQNLRAMTPKKGSLRIPAAQAHPDRAAPPKQAKTSTTETAEVPPTEAPSGSPRAIRSLALGAPQRRSDPLTARFDEWRSRLESGRGTNFVGECLAFLHKELDSSHLFLLTNTDDPNTLQVVAGAGEHHEELALHIFFEVKKNGADVFSRSCVLKKDYVLRDTFSRRSTQLLPQCYYETLGAPALALWVCATSKNGRPLLLLADFDDERALANPERLSAMTPYKQLLARAYFGKPPSP